MAAILIQSKAAADASSAAAAADASPDGESSSQEPLVSREDSLLSSHPEPVASLEPAAVLDAAPMEPAVAASAAGEASSPAAEPPPLDAAASPLLDELALADESAVAPVCPWSAIDARAAPESVIRWSVHANLSDAPALEGAMRLHVAGCDLQWTAAAARKCLRRLGHVVLAGDSITRLQYISLVHFLHTGSWSPRDGLPPGDSPRHWASAPQPGDDGPRIDFPRYFSRIAARLGGAEICDCYIGTEHIENRYYRAGALRLTYLSAFKALADVVYHDTAWLNATCGAARCAQAGCAPGACNDAAHQRRVRLPDFLSGLADRLRPDVLVLNMGVHEEASQRETPEALARVHNITASLSARARGSAVPRGLVWKTTTPGKEEAVKWGDWQPRNASARAREGRPPPLAEAFAPPGPWPVREQLLRDTVLAAGGRVYDTHTLLYPLVTSLARAGVAHGPFAHAIDIWHFAPAVNAELNKALLAKLCEGVA